jgi:predicted transcriptional regulator YdeE
MISAGKRQEQRQRRFSFALTSVRADLANCLYNAQRPMKSPRLRHLCIRLITFAAALVCTAYAETGLTTHIVSLEPFQVVGIEASTNNRKEAGPDAIIGSLWQRFIKEDLLNQIPDKVDQSIIAVYTDYATDANGQYTFVLGAKVKPVPNPAVPAGMVVKFVPAGRYAVFTSERGPIAKVVVETWKQIWAYYQSPANGQRVYGADFELYDQRAADPDHAQVDIYIGFK